MSEAEVRAILGEPSEVKKGSFDKLLVWRSGRKDISIEFTADKACAVGYTRLYEKTIWEILIQYAKKGVKWD